MLVMAEMNVQFQRLISQYSVNRIYRLNQRMIQIDKNRGANKKIEFKNDGSISITSQKLTLKLLRNFGRLILRIKLGGPFSNLWRNRILSYIIQYCRETLKELNLSYFHEDMIREWKPFLNVTTVGLYVGHWYCEDNKNHFHEMFPLLRHLNIDKISFSSSRCIDHHFPHLKHIQIPMYIDYPVYKEKMYDNIFDLNPQLQSIHMWNMDSFDVLRVANDKLHNLEAIEVSFVRNYIYNVNDSSTIHFKNVKRLYVRTYAHAQHIDNVIPLELDQLEELILGASVPMSGKWMEFVIKQRQLKMLSLLGREDRINYLDWMLIIRNVPQLEMIRTRCSIQRNSNEIVQLMTTQTNIKKIVLFDMTEEKYDILMDIIDHEWEVEGTAQQTREEITFIRRKQTEIEE